MPRSTDPRRPHWNEGVPPLEGRGYDATAAERSSRSAMDWECAPLLGLGADEAALWRVAGEGAPAWEDPGPAWPPGTFEAGALPGLPGVRLGEFARSRGAAGESGALSLGAEWDGSTFRLGVRAGESLAFYGTGEVAGPLLRNGRTTTLWNTDAWCYGEETEALYQSHPFVLGLRPDGGAFGLYAVTARRGRIELAEDGVEFAFEGAGCALVVLRAEHPAGVLDALTTLLGRAPTPPDWALGYHQCRWSYSSADEVRALVDGFRAHDLPLAAVWLDIDHMDRCRVFTWDRERFPDPRGLVEDLHAEGVRVVSIVDPGVAVDSALAGELLAGDHAVRSAEGPPVQARVWPGSCLFPDFTRPETRAWWAERVQGHVAAVPLDGLWCDMNEPAAARTPARTLPGDARHAGGEGWPAGDHARWHNLYGHGMVAATRAGLEAALRARGEKESPFVLTRAAHAVTSRFAATWTGDNQARWEDLAWAIPMTLNLGLSGQPCAGPDLGGFYGDPEPELFARWFEVCVGLPFYRGHSEKTSCRKEPWSFGPAVLARVRQALRLRERLRPDLRRAFALYAESGAPPVRPLWWLDPVDPELRDVDDAYLVGDTLLVAPFVAPGPRRRSVRLPEVEGGWTPLWDESSAPLPGGRLDLDGETVAIPVLRRTPPAP